MRHYKGEVGTSMTTFRVTNKMRQEASSGSYKLSKEERKTIKKHNRELKRAKKMMRLQQDKTQG